MADVPPADVVDGVRERASVVLSELAARGAQLDASGEPRTSWVDGGQYDPRRADARKAAFDRDGFLVVPRFADAATVARMRAEMDALADTWEPGVSVVRFSTDASQLQHQARSDYFLDSADRVHFFAEPGALDPASGELRVPKALALNKAGHGLHVDSASAFGAYARSEPLAELVAALGWRDPVLPQSMYIFKQPRHGGEVTSHQDSTFLHTEPRQSCLGLWLALDDATLTNGCLWVRPGSHVEPLRRRFERNSRHFGDAAAGVPPDPSAPQMVFKELAPPAGAEHGAGARWEGALPDGSWPLPCAGLFAAGFAPVEVRAGDLVCFPGLLDHLSLPNHSAAARHTFQLHLVEGPGAGVRWSKSNWLQYPPGVGFPHVPRPACQTPQGGRPREEV
ncbi:hypothetical protein KFE25_002908 [Diacronema lutheri]|uniref:Phytanoyl-CoA dioxygenase n=2 Tax=Diacronema lutheri TaxID=2081491 RepID=A0A8J5XJ25_DIALT|nr:hypothetical protein KFE25_002908 [Diacronema lutheri]